MRTILAATAAALSCAVAAPALAQSANSDLNAAVVIGYGNLGYSLVDSSNEPTLSALHGRLGARFMRYLGVEGEGDIGINTKTDALGDRVKVKSSVGAYAVGFLPVAPRFDLLARVGYSHDVAKINDVGVGENSFDYGVGAQGFFTANDGVRFDWTRHDLRNGGPDANVWQLSYVRKFP